MGYKLQRTIVGNTISKKHFFFLNRYLKRYYIMIKIKT